MKKIKPSFYQGHDVVDIARQLIGKVLVTNFDDVITSGIIVETEAYAGVQDKASHAFGSRRTNRTETMYAAGGVAYVYLCYGIHHLFNIVTNKEDIPHAVLIRALEPLEGIEIMVQRRKKKVADYTLTKGPGSMSAALGIYKTHNGLSLETSDHIWLEDRKLPTGNILSGPRIGVDYAGEDALLPYRFWVEGNKYVSGKG
jgi:DNA-3-methyladenine glycosylase